MGRKTGRILGALAGATIGFLAGGPLGAAAGYSAALAGAAGAAAGGAIGGVAGTGMDKQQDAAKIARREAIAQTESLKNASLKADRFAEAQRKQQERALQKVAAGRTRAAARRVRGGLFGDDAGTTSSYSISGTLG